MNPSFAVFAVSRKIRFSVLLFDFHLSYFPISAPFKILRGDTGLVYFRQDIVFPWVLGLFFVGRRVWYD